jgi:hypothetical protein
MSPTWSELVVQCHIAAATGRDSDGVVTVVGVEVDPDAVGSGPTEHVEYRVTLRAGVDADLRASSAKDGQTGVGTCLNYHYWTVALVRHYDPARLELLA